MSDSKVGVLFVCLGNICRSPTAEGVFRERASRAGMTSVLDIDSCGTGDWHIGKSPDPRAIAAAQRRNINIAQLRARQVVPEDFDRFHYVLAMDLQNLSDLSRLRLPEQRTEPRLFLDYSPNKAVREVPDPYFGGREGFETVLDLIEAASEGLLNAIRREHL